jgi:hypothetical protein
MTKTRDLADLGGGFIQEGTGAVQRTVESKLQDVVSVKDFGAVGDGTTNDTTAVQTAVNAVGAGGAVYFPKGSYFVTSLTGATNILFFGSGASFTGGFTRKIGQVGSITGDDQRQYDFMGCAIRSDSGSFAFINDAFHQETGLSSVTQPDSTTVRVNYNKTASKVGTFVVGADDALAEYGVVAGGDVGLSYANIKAAAPINFSVNGAGTVTTTSLWSGSITASVASNVLTITHPTIGDTNDSVVATPINGSVLRNVHVSWGATTIELRVMDEMNGYISYDGSSWAWLSSLSNNVSGPSSFTWTASNTLRVTHADAGDSYGIVLTPHQDGAINPVVYDVAATYFEVAFYDAAGTQITTQSTGMKFWYRRNVQVQSKIPSGLQVAVRRGYAVVPVANWSNVAGNNFWIMGAMENNT